MSVKGKWELKKVYVNTYYCDHCKKKCEFVAVNLNYNYGSEVDGDSLVFCSDKCFNKWAKKWVNK